MSVKTTIEQVEERQRKTTFKVTALVVTGVLISVGIVNIFQQAYVNAFLELFLSVLFFAELFVINKKVPTDVLSNILLYLTSGMLLRIMTTSSVIEIGAFAGLLGLLTVAYFLLKSQTSFLVYPIVITLIYIVLVFLGKLPLRLDEALKILVVYSASAVAFYINRVINTNKSKQLQNLEDALESSNEKLNKQKYRLLNTTTRFRLATSSAGIGVWEWDIDANKLIWNKEMYHLYGVSRNTNKNPFDYWQKGLHPMDAKLVEDAMQASLDGEADYNLVYRIMKPNGEVRYIKSSALVERNQNNKPIKMIGVNWDVTTEKILDQEKTEFVSLASHQLRTPLTAISWYTELLLKDTHKRLNKEQKNYLHEVAVGNKRMIELVSALLNISRLEMGTVMVEPKETDIASIVESVRMELHHELSKRHQKLMVLVEKNVPVIYSDPNLVRIIIQNLVSNAIKYTPNKSTIQLTTRLNSTKQNKNNHLIPHNAVVINVKDDGFGIPEKEQQKVFEKMYRASNIMSKNTEGTGLGLYMVKMLCNILQADIWFESKEKAGTDFYFVLPVKAKITKTGTKQLES